MARCWPAVAGHHATATATMQLWSVRSGVSLHTLRSDRPYERVDITGLTGVTDAQRAALLTLGAFELP